MRYALLNLKGHEVQVRPDGYWWRPTALDKFVLIGELRKQATAFLGSKERQVARLRADKIKQQARRELALKLEGKEARKLVPKRPYHLATSRAKRHGINIMTPEQYNELWKRADGRCEVSGIQFSYERHQGCLRRPWAPSIDRIDSNKDYHADNCRLVCGAVNVAMGEYGTDVLVQMARAVVLKYGP